MAYNILRALAGKSYQTLQTAHSQTAKVRQDMKALTVRFMNVAKCGRSKTQMITGVPKEPSASGT